MHEIIIKQAQCPVATETTVSINYKTIKSIVYVFLPMGTEYSFKLNALTYHQKSQLNSILAMVPLSVTKWSKSNIES